MSPKLTNVLRLTKELSELNAEVANEATRLQPSAGYLEAWSSRLLKRAAELHTVCRDYHERGGA